MKYEKRKKLIWKSIPVDESLVGFGDAGLILVLDTAYHEKRKKKYKVAPSSDVYKSSH